MSKYGGGSVDVDAIHILQESTFEMNYDDKGSVTLGMGVIYNEIHSYEKILRYIDKMKMMDDCPHLFVAKSRNGIHAPTKEGIEFQTVVNLAIQVNKHREYYTLYPEISCFSDFVVKHGIWDLISDGCVSLDVQAKLRQQYKKLLYALKSYKLMAKTYAFMKGPKKNAKSLRGYVNALFKRHARLDVIRVDVSYLEEFRDKISVEEVFTHRKVLFDDLRKGVLAKSWVGFACRLEYGPDTGWHWHLVVFLNGAVVHSDTFYGFQIIGEWNRVTANRGRGFNCNMKAGAGGYRFCGIGKVDHFDIEKRAYLNKALAYLTKSDRLAKLRVKNRRTFLRGIMPKNNSKRGRPRVKGLQHI